MEKTRVFMRIIEELDGNAAALTSVTHSLTTAKKGAMRSVGQNRIMAITDAASLLVAAACLESASLQEVKLAETSLFIAEKLIGNKAYDSDKFDDDLLKKQDVEMIAPHRHNRTKAKTQNGS